ncbi:MAG: efflux RND transporter permease subunit [Phycisphaerales bacterium]|jgi:HAE1 family hydrophobic/amphiphilic exporter-1|nr:efflux RND transporter permease subunit [Phycisphaerales bacterium]
MDIVGFSVKKPVSISVGVLLVVMFGLIGLTAIPIQLTPTVDRPIITIKTDWPGRSPDEVVDEITKEQEEQLKNVSNLKRMKSVSREGGAEVTLEFYIGTNINRALLEVMDALRQVPAYPEEVEEPQVEAADGASENAIAWMIIDLPPEKRAMFPDFDISTLFDPLDKEVKPFLERIDGVAEVNIYGGREREVRVLVDATALAQRGLNHVDVINALRGENVNVSAGTIAEGKRDYRVRLIGQYQDPSEVLETVVAYREGKPVYVKDVATVELGHEKRRGFVRSFGQPSIAMNCIRQTGANVVDVMSQLRGRLDEVRSDILPNLAGEVGPHLRLRQVYDETTYISSAISLVTDNLWIGALIAAGVLLIFLRSFVSTGVIALAIPIAVVGTFLVMLGLGRTLNVVSLAGLAFATGMVVDNAIVVLENIDRRRKLGDPPMQAALNGAREVWGAILASTLTTVAVFVPVLTIQEEAGQLFRDIALAIVASVSLSLIVSITVIPSACSRWLGHAHEPRTKVGKVWHGLFGIAPLADAFLSWMGGALRWLMSGWRSYTIGPAIVVLMTAISLIGSARLAPPMDYLPAGNRNLVFGGLLIPPGLSIEQQEQIAQRIEANVEPYFHADIKDPQSVATLPPIFRYDAPESPFAPVPVENFFIGAFNGGMFVGGTSQDPQVVIPVGSLLTNAMGSIPDSFGGAAQSSIFGRGVASGNTVDVEISGPKLERVNAAARFMFMTAMGRFGPGNARPDPANFSVQQQEWRLRLNDLGRELGLSTQTLGFAVRGLFDGAFAGDFRLGADTIDLNVLPAGGRLDYKEELAGVPIATPAGPVVPLDTVVDVVPALAPQQIQRIEELPSVTVSVRPPEGMTIQELEEWLTENVVEPARTMGLIDRTMRVRMEGTAAQLDDVRVALFGPPVVVGSASHGWQLWLSRLGWVVVAFGAAGMVYAVVRAARAKRTSQNMFWGAVGVLLLGAILGLSLVGIANQPNLMLARFVWALLVTYLLMAALFESFLYPLVIMFSVPLAIVGGFLGLRLVHDATVADPRIAPQQFDTLTMLGFVILIGVVVNNAILIVHQSLNLMRGEGDDGKIAPMEPIAAVAEATRTRVRPIFMSVLTSVGGMLPLVLFPGPGSEMYRGLGSVVIGGLMCSTIFTLVLVPILFSLVLRMQAGVRWMFAGGRGTGDQLGGGDSSGAPQAGSRTSRESTGVTNGTLAPVAFDGRAG